MGMGRALADASPAAAAVFARADAALGEPISRLAFDGPEEELNRTENAQPALLAASIAYLEALRERWARVGIDAPDPAFAAGHSMGQYSALVAAGALDLADARPPRPRARPPDAGVGRRARGADGRRSSAWTTPRSPSSSARRRARRVRRREPQLPGPGRGVGRARRRRGGARDRQGAGREARDRAPGQRRGPLAADGRGRRRACAAVLAGITFHDPAAAAARQRRRPAAHHRRRGAAPSSSTTSRPASTGSPPSRRCAPPASPRSSRSARARS